MSVRAMAENSCGSCTMCCRLMGVTDLEPPKPTGKWCTHCDKGVGCKIYDSRPVSCQEFECMWLQAQARDEVRPWFPPEVRPDRSKVVFYAGKDGKGLGVRVDPGYPDAWRSPIVADIWTRVVEAGETVAIMIGDKRIVFANGNYEPITYIERGEEA